MWVFKCSRNVILSECYDEAGRKFDEYINTYIEILDNICENAIQSGEVYKNLNMFKEDVSKFYWSWLQYCKESKWRIEERFMSDMLIRDFTEEGKDRLKDIISDIEIKQLCFFWSWNCRCRNIKDYREYKWAFKKI